MRFTTAFFAKVALAAMFGSGALAAPWAPAVKHTTHSVRELKSGLKLESYHPESTYEVSFKYTP
jgi:extracellular elastinolytic metalloproteinase